MAATCPNCQGLLTTRPTRKKKCPHCGRYIYVRQGQLVGESQPIIETKITYANLPAAKSNPKVKNESNPLAAILVIALIVLSLCFAVLLIRGRSESTPTPASLPTVTPVRFLPASSPVAPSGGCCKICGPNSKACGDSCISNSDTCYEGPGCACEG